MKLLEIKNISKSFKNEKVVDNISLSIDKGETVGIIGPSGGGKTTFLRCINFLETADEGQIYINGELLYDARGNKLKDEELRKIRKHFGLVFQNFNLFPQYSVLENVTLAMKIAGKDNCEEEAMELLDKLGLKNKANSYPEKLSGGQQQRVAIARALALKPDILCFDEPTSALDPGLTSEISKVINDLKSKDTAMIIVSHDMEFAKKVSDRIVLLLDGKIIEEAKAEDFFANPKNEKTKAFLNS